MIVESLEMSDEPYFKIVVTVLLMLHLCEPDGLLLAVEYGYCLRIGGYFIVCEPPAADAQLVVAFLLYLLQVLLHGYSSIKAYEHFVLRIIRHACLGVERVHHVGQRVRVCGVSCKDGRITYEAFLVDAQCQYEQFAVRALLLGTSELSFLAVVLASFEIEVGQIEDRYPVRYVEQVVRLLAEVAFKLFLQFIE